MAEYKPLFVYLEPASIPQVVAHIQKYLAENPIVSDPEAIAEAIQKYIEDHPEIIASVNGKTGNVVLTGSDIMINPSSAVSVETQLLNLASMINNTGADIKQIQDNISQIYTTIGTIQTDVETNASNISALQTSVEGQGTRLAAAETDIDNLETAQTAQGTRLAAAETDIDNLETAQTAQGTRLNTAEGNISSLQTQMTQAENDIETNESNIDTLNTSLQKTNTTIDEIKSNIIFNSENGDASGTLLQNVKLYKKIKVYWGTQDKYYLYANEALNNNVSKFAMPVSYSMVVPENNRLYVNCARINFNGKDFTTNRIYTVTIFQASSSDNVFAEWSGFRVFRIEGVLK